MEYVALLIISILGLALIVVEVVTVAANLDKNFFISKTNNYIKTKRQKQLTKEEKIELRNKYRQGKSNSIRQIKTV